MSSFEMQIVLFVMVMMNNQIHFVRCLKQRESGFDQLGCSGTCLHLQELLQLEKILVSGTFFGDSIL